MTEEKTTKTLPRSIETKIMRARASAHQMGCELQDYDAWKNARGLEAAGTIAVMFFYLVLGMGLGALIVLLSH